jgi:hypothetical protein
MATIKTILMKSITLCLSLVFCTLAYGQFWKKQIKGNGELVTKNLRTDSYDAIKLSSSMDVLLVEGTEGDLEITAESNLIEYLDIYESNGTLYLDTKDNSNLYITKGIKVKVPVEHLNEIVVTGSGEVYGETLLRSRALELSISGSGDIILQSESRILNATVTGSGDMSLTGNTEELVAKVTGSGEIQAFKLKANDVKASVTGSGDIYVFVNGGALNASVTGSGDITYDGVVKNINTSTTGSGDIERK